MKEHFVLSWGTHFCPDCSDCIGGNIIILKHADLYKDVYPPQLLNGPILSFPLKYQRYDFPIHIDHNYF